MNTYWSAHTHSKYSAKDGMPSVDLIVNRAKELEYPALGLTDHGNMGGAVQLYTNCRKADIKPLPGIEAYISLDKHTRKRDTMHMGMLAVSQKGYYNLVGLSNLAHRNWAEHKTYKPILDLADFAEAYEDGRLDGVVAMSGCWFGVLPELLKEQEMIYDEKVANIITSLAKWFKDGFYIEIQNHAIIDKPDQDEEEHNQHLFSIAQHQGLPILINQDSHYVHEYEQPLHDTMKMLTSWSTEPEEGIFPGDGYHMVDTQWMSEHHAPNIFKAGMEGLADLESKAKVVIPELDNFSLMVPDTTVTGDPDKELTDLSNKSLLAKIESGIIKARNKSKYLARLEEELDVITGAGFSGYILLSKAVCEHMDEVNIFYNIRGSASGSLVCWLLGITSFDPIVWGLRFDRFLSKDRTKPPDIDIDIEHERKEDVEMWLSENFYTVKIGTWQQMGLSDDDGEQKGSLMIRWKMYAKKVGIDPNRNLTNEEWTKLKALADKKAYLGYGVHAAGVLVAPDEQSAESVPIQYVASSRTMVTAFDKDDVERSGKVKLDLLGLKTLTAVSSMCAQTGINIKDIPLNDKKVYQAMSKGETIGLFQLEGGASRSGVRRLKPNKITDVIAAMALFRPATMESGATDDFISRRQGYEQVPERHPIISEETKETYGVLLYQEQVIGVMKSIGLETEEIEKARKAIKASNASVGNAAKDLLDLMKRIRTLAKEKGMNDSDLTWLEQALNAYAGYGFNKAHATAYGVFSYITGYFAVHHPLAFWAGMLRSYTGAKQEPIYLKAARDAGVRMRPPHVNISQKGYTADKETNSIRKGLTTIKGLGDKAADEIVMHAPYSSLDDFARKVSGRRVTGSKDLGKGHSPEACGGIVAALFEAGALSGLEREQQ